MLMIAFAFVVQGFVGDRNQAHPWVRIVALLLGTGYLSLTLYSWIAMNLVARFEEPNPPSQTGRE